MKVGDRVRRVDRAGVYLVYQTDIITTLDQNGKAHFKVTYYAKSETSPNAAFTFRPFDIHRKVFIVPKEPDLAQISMWDQHIG